MKTGSMFGLSASCSVENKVRVAEGVSVLLVRTSKVEFFLIKSRYMCSSASDGSDYDSDWKDDVLEEALCPNEQEEAVLKVRGRTSWYG